MNIIYITSEVVPFAKTGGLGDVAGALPKFVAELGHEISVITPFYRQAKAYCRSAAAEQRAADTGISLSVPMPNGAVTARVFESVLPGSAVPVYLIGNDEYYDRDELYFDRATNADYEDNCERFVFFCRAALETIQALHLRPDVLHCNDWHTALIPVYLKTLYAERKPLSDARTLLTVHNLAYQGVFWHWDMKLTGLDWGLFNWRQLEFYGKLNCLKAGLVFADLLSTVSRRYAEEIQTEQFGRGLDGVLKERSNDLYGVVNGIDHSIWNPEVDELIPAKYSADDMSGKAVCKEALLNGQGLPRREATPLVGVISRLAPQKGFDIVEVALDELMQLDLQMVVLGTGDRRYHEMFKAAAKKCPDKLAVNLTFDDRLAHQIEAGCDMFLMPSRYEPCGLNQLYSLKYGTVPVVRATGGLADTVVDCDGKSLRRRTATGFVFEKYNPVRLLAAVERAIETYHRPAHWTQLVRTGMAQDWSWHRSAREYIALYEKVTE